MYKDFLTIEELKQTIIADKEVSIEEGASNLNRFPLRFILTDSFVDCFNLIEWLQVDQHVHVESVDKWMDKRYPDLMISYQELGEAIEEYVMSLAGNDGLVAPFSELARFYDNTKDKTFDALIKSIKGIQASIVAHKNHQRIYIPIVGLEEKMQAFKNESQITIWHLNNLENHGYNVVIMNDSECYGVKGLESQFNVVHSMREWLNIWKDNDAQQKHTIITTSRTIFTDSVHAQPDNAFTYFTPKNVFQFLTKGLGLVFEDISYRDADEDKWVLLAQQIDMSQSFSFDTFVKHYFGVASIDDSMAFLKLWFTHSVSFDRWLLSLFYLAEHKSKGFLCRCIEKSVDYSNRSLFTEVALDMTTISTEMQERRRILNVAADNNVVLTEDTVSLLGRRLEAIPQKMGYRQALQYFTRLTNKEKEIAIVWLGKGYIKPIDVSPFFQELAFYIKSGLTSIAGAEAWMDDYIQSYKEAKMANQYTGAIESQITKKNADSVTFDTWYQKLKTTSTWLYGRSDIDVIYWIDGIGVDWIPYVSELLKAHENENIYLNDTIIARAILPTTTEVNKQELQKLTGKPLQKIGDLDGLAHRNGNIYPNTILLEMEIIREAIDHIVNTYAGKKIAIVSDHGISYMPQLCSGLNLSGIESDHYGRLAVNISSGTTRDKNYILLEGQNIACALNHHSLASKVPKGQGCHGGCTPEEVLVPIFIISNSPTECCWTYQLITNELSGINNKLRIKITGLRAEDNPVIEYGHKIYPLKKVLNEEYETAPLDLNETDTSFELIVGNVCKLFNIDIRLGGEEIDIFEL